MKTLLAVLFFVFCFVSYAEESIKLKGKIDVESGITLTADESKKIHHLSFWFVQTEDMLNPIHVRTSIKSVRGGWFGIFGHTVQSSAEIANSLVSLLDRAQKKRTTITIIGYHSGADFYFSSVQCEFGALHREMDFASASRRD